MSVLMEALFNPCCERGPLHPSARARARRNEIALLPNGPLSAQAPSMNKREKTEVALSRA